MTSLLKSNTLKFVSSRWSLCGWFSAVLIPPIFLFFTLNAQPEIQAFSEQSLTVYLQFLSLAQLGIILAAASFIGEEFTRSSMRTTLLICPSRIKLMLANGLVILLSTFIAFFLANLLSLLVLANQLSSSESIYSLLFLNHLVQVIPTILSWLFLGLISANLALLFQSLIAPIASLFPLILGLSQMILSFTKLAIYLPDLAVNNLFQLTQHPIFLAPFEGVSVQFIWCLSLAILAGFFFQKRAFR
ncbi:hypothetical protein BAU15_06615 [Enterococcus sp. JM4C]|uniref:hypothetical protein n=1 Tax=Candidatus Enterococcus huntleyi TaxID=1857217 RepID=UPI0013798DA4|nr:hypothetical protein [Enterococcus sp. JM4C]KAF1297216.1 hypothetical protein BAU15_06615 [Enterococcus sp. JM4C]